MCGEKRKKLPLTRVDMHGENRKKKREEGERAIGRAIGRERERERLREREKDIEGERE